MCKFCTGIPDFLIRSLVSDLDDRNTEQHWSVQGFEKGAEQGCILCVLISNGFRNCGNNFPSYRYCFENLTEDEKYEDVMPFGMLLVWKITLGGMEVCHFRVEKSWDREIRTSRNEG